MRAIWGDDSHEMLLFLWQSRDPSDSASIHWDIGHNPLPSLPVGLIVLHLAGKTSGRPDELAQNARITEAVCRAAVAASARHVFLMSTAAVYAPAPGLLDETASPAPNSAYGTSKLAAETVAAQVMQGRLTILRLANLAGADALLGPQRQEVMLDPVEGQPGGPVRSYIGPRALAQILSDLLRLAAVGAVLPDVLNLAQHPPVAMADLLQARGQTWRFGPPRAGVVARVALNTDRLAAFVDLPSTSPKGLIADMNSVPGWP